MKRIIKTSVALLLVLLFTAVCSLTAFASNVTYDGNAKDYVLVPGSDLFDQFKNVMPGDTLTQMITLDNIVDANTKTTFYLKSDGWTKGSQEFLSKLTLKVEEVDGPVVYNGPADKAGELADGIKLGTLYQGESMKLKLTLSVPKTLDNNSMSKAGEITWTFSVDEQPVSQPKTGDEPTYYIYILAGAFALVIVSLLVVLLTKNKKDEDK